jgi:hypothetical protein
MDASVLGAFLHGPLWCKSPLVPDGDLAAELAVDSSNSYSCCPSLWSAVAASSAMSRPLLAAALLRAAAHVCQLPATEKVLHGAAAAAGGGGEGSWDGLRGGEGAVEMLEVTLKLPPEEGPQAGAAGDYARFEVVVGKHVPWLWRQLMEAAGKGGGRGGTWGSFSRASFRVPVGLCH